MVLVVSGKFETVLGQFKTVVVEGSASFQKFILSENYLALPKTI